MPAGGPGWIIVDADRHGVLLFDTQRREYRGINRAGDVVWRSPAPALLAVCIGTCPDAALSGSQESFNSTHVPDPTPILFTGSKQSTVENADRVLGGASRAELVTSRGTSLRLGSLEVTVGGRHTTLHTSPDGRHALALTQAGDGTQARWFTRLDTGWQAIGPALLVAATRACLSASGDTAMLLGRQPALLHRGGTTTPVTDLVSAGTCAFSGSGVLVAELAQGAGGRSRSRLRALTATGTVTWRLDLDQPISLCADALSTRALYVAAGVLHELDIRDGSPLRTITGVSAACFDDTGAIIVVQPDGSIGYLPARSN